MNRRIPHDRLTLLEGSDQGLNDVEATALRERYGANRIAEQQPKTLSGVARDAAGDPMLWFLLLASSLFGLTGEYADMAVLLAAILPLMGMDFYLHRRTQASIEGLGGVLASRARVLRSGAERDLAAAEIVPGDLVLVDAGAAFPADVVILEGEALQAEESALTGEAFPIAKRGWRAEDRPPAEGNWGFAGTRLLTGRATARVLFTGMDSLYGEVVRQVLAGPEGRTRLQRAVARLVGILLLAAIAICILLAAVRLRQGFGLVDAALSAATLAVAAIPEEFPVVLTFFLAAGVYRLARSQALVRRATAVENIGRVSAICTDKTGTITEGRLRLRETRQSRGLDRSYLLRLAALASRGDSGDPLDAAIFAEAGSPEEGWRRLALFPFTEGRRREAALWRSDTGEVVVALKGAVETVLDRCGMDEAMRADWLAQASSMAAAGQKVIGCAWRADKFSSAEEPRDGFRFAGLLGFSDPLRPGVRKAVAAALADGIQIVMVTGDHAETARAIAREAGMPSEAMIVSGDELEARLSGMEADELRALGIVARASPRQKFLLVAALQRAGRIVAVTGDGVNDAPALKAADVGVAMGVRGTRSAREVSAIVLLDDDFGTIVKAIAEGRQLLSNLRRSFAFLLMIHIPLVATAALIPLLGYPLLYLPVHIVWLELLIHPAAILAFQQRADYRRLPRRDTRDAFFDRRQWVAIVATGLGLSGGILALYLLGIAAGEGAEHARSSALVALVVALAMLVVLLTRMCGRAAVAVAAAAVTSSLLACRSYAFAGLLHMHLLAPSDWLLSASVGAATSLPAMFFQFRLRSPSRGGTKAARPSERSLSSRRR